MNTWGGPICRTDKRTGGDRIEFYPLDLWGQSKIIVIATTGTDRGDFTLTPGITMLCYYLSAQRNNNKR